MADRKLLQEDWLADTEPRVFMGERDQLGKQLYHEPLLSEIEDKWIPYLAREAATD